MLSLHTSIFVGFFYILNKDVSFREPTAARMLQPGGLMAPNAAVAGVTNLLVADFNSASRQRSRSAYPGVGFLYKLSRVQTVPSNCLYQLVSMCVLRFYYCHPSCIKCSKPCNISTFLKSIIF